MVMSARPSGNAEGAPAAATPGRARSGRPGARARAPPQPRFANLAAGRLETAEARERLAARPGRPDALRAASLGLKAHVVPQFIIQLAVDPIAMEYRVDNPFDRVLPVLGPQREVVRHMRALPHRDLAAALESSAGRAVDTGGQARLRVPGVDGGAIGRGAGWRRGTRSTRPDVYGSSRPPA